jgi:hypothetical protein
MSVPMAQPAKEIRVEITSPIVALVQVGVAPAQLVEIQLALEQVQVALEKHQSLREQLSLVVAVDHFVVEAMQPEPVAQVEVVAEVREQVLDPLNRMQRVAHNLELRILVAVVEQVFSKGQQPTVRAHRAEQVLWSLDGSQQVSPYSHNQLQIQQLPG